MKSALQVMAEQFKKQKNPTTALSSFKTNREISALFPQTIKTSVPRLSQAVYLFPILKYI